MIRIAIVFVSLNVFSLAHAQAAPATLTLEQALATARQQNGTVRSALLNYEAAKAQTRGAYSAFLPSVTPSLRQENGRLQTHTGPGRGSSSFDSTDASVTASWLILDNGSRGARFARSRLQRESTEYQTLDTLRSVLFSVHQSFYDALRAQELLKVQASSVSRFKEILDRAILREEVGAGPKKDILQARADYLNAQVNEIGARNQVATSQANLKAVLGWPDPELPVLEQPAETEVQSAFETLDAAQSAGQQNRPSLLSVRARVRSAETDVQLARLDSIVDFSVSAQHTKSFSESAFDRSGLVLQANFPLYDGNATREALKATQFSLESQRQSLLQSERNVSAEVESAFKEFSQNIERRRAAGLALEAARLNYQAADDAMKEGATDLIEQLTAQVSLATAEANFVQAYYDLLISEVRLRLVTGMDLPGEAVEQK